MDKKNIIEKGVENVTLGELKQFCADIKNTSQSKWYCKNCPLDYVPEGESFCDTVFGEKNVALALNFNLVTHKLSIKIDKKEENNHE